MTGKLPWESDLPWEEGALRRDLAFGAIVVIEEIWNCMVKLATLWV
jgi:hypothetical protein